MGTHQVLLIPVDETEPISRVSVDSDPPRSLAELQDLVEGDIEALPVPGSDRLTAYINENGKTLALPSNHRATRLIGPLLFAGDYIAGPLVVCGFDPDQGTNLDCPPGFETQLQQRRELPEPAEVSHGGRSITYTWVLDEDADHKRELATLSVGHSRGGVSMLSGQTHGPQLTAVLTNLTDEPSLNGLRIARMRLGGGVMICHQPLARFSVRRLTEFSTTATDTLRELYGDSDPRVTRYFRLRNGAAL